MTPQKKHFFGLTLLAAALALSLLASGTDEVRAAQDKEVNKEIQDIAELLKQGKKDAAKAKVAALTAKFDLDDMMDVFKPVKRGGLAIGNLPGGIEATILALEKDGIKREVLIKEAAALEDMAHVIAAMADITKIKPPGKGRQRVAWLESSAQMRTAAVKLGQAAKAKKPEEVKAAAITISQACTRCHKLF